VHPPSSLGGGSVVALPSLAPSARRSMEASPAEYASGIASLPFAGGSADASITDGASSPRGGASTLASSAGRDASAPVSFAPASFALASFAPASLSMGGVVLSMFTSGGVASDVPVPPSPGGGDPMRNKLSPSKTWKAPSL
jgi:hypothetical protein